MKILSLISSADIGGAEVHVEHIVSHLTAEHVVVTLADGPMVARYRAAGAEVHILPTPGKMPLKTLPDLEQIIKNINPDIIHTHTPKANLMGAMSRSRCRRIMTIHGSHLQFASSRTIPAAWYKWADLWAAKRVHAVIAVCEADRRELIAAGFSSSKTVVIPNGVPDPKTSGERPRGEILWVGRMSPEKGPETMIHVARMLASHPSLNRISMIGDGPLLPSIARDASRIAKLTIEKPRASLSDVWPNVTLLVNTSYSEGASLAILEALAAGVPVVAAGVGGNSELIGNAGVIVSPESGSPDIERASLFAAAIKQILENDELLRSAARIAQSRYCEHFKVEHMIERLATLYKEALS